MRKGLVLSIDGPDGTGKSSVGDALAERFKGPTLRVHHRPGVLPSGSPAGDVTQPHAKVPRTRFSSIMKVGYIFVDYLVGWMTRIAPLRRKGGLVVIERSWFDLIVDPERYRVKGAEKWIRLLARIMPRADLRIVLLASPEVLLVRKQELPTDELGRQLLQWSVESDRLGMLSMDCAVPLEQVVAGIERAVGNLLGVPGLFGDP